MQLHPTTEKVPARRGLPLAVGVLALAFVALLVAKPWEPRPAAAPSAPPAVAVVATPVSAETPAPPTIEPTPAPTRAPTPAPTPDIAEIGPLGEIALPYTPGEAMAQCSYGRPRSNGTRRLAGITVQPPTVLLDSRSSISDIRRAGWSLELQRIRAEDLFSREWVTVGRSRTQVLGLSFGQATRFAPLTVPLTDRGGETDLYRVRMVIDWYTRNLELAGRATIVANHYQEGAAEQVGTWPPHCRGVLAQAR